MYNISELLSNFLPYVLAYADDMTRCPHAYDLVIIIHAVKGSMNSNPVFSECFFYVKRNLHIARIHITILQKGCIEFIDWMLWISNS